MSAAKVSSAVEIIPLRLQKR